MQTIKIINLDTRIVSIKISFPDHVLAGFLHKGLRVGQVGGRKLVAIYSIIPKEMIPRRD